jgi:hypothetical protein
MSKTLVLCVSLALILAACGAQRGNRAEPAAVAENTNPLIPERSDSIFSRRDQVVVYPGTPIETVSAVLVERVPGGAIIRAEGVAGVQGVYDVRLTPATEDEVAEDGVLTYRLEGIRPAGTAAVGPPNTREVIAARRVTDRSLEGVRSIRVEGLQNAQSVRR